MAERTPTEKDFLSKFGRAVKEIRLEEELSQEELGHASNLDRSYVGGVERGERNISLLRVRQLAEGLGVEIATILDRMQDQ